VLVHLVLLVASPGGYPTTAITFETAGWRDPTHNVQWRLCIQLRAW
jgi:hypothetical protein